MQTLPQSTSKAKYATVYDAACTLAHVNRVLYVIYDDGRIEEFSIAMAPFTVVLGDVQTAEPAAMWDRIAGGPAALCTSRQMLEV